MMNEIATTNDPAARMKRGTTRLVTATALALVLAALGVAGVSAAVPTSNKNAELAPLVCGSDRHTVWVWANSIASERSAGAAPARVISGDPGRVFKVISVSGPEGTFFTHFDGASDLERVVCEDPWGNSLTGVFIP